MKKGSLFVLFFFCFLSNVYAIDKKQVFVKDCVDGDTLKIELDGKEETVRLLAVDTPETKHPTKKEEPYGKEASTFTCEKIKNASLLEIEYDENSDEKDKYDRILAWVFVDGSLLQEELIEKGYAKVAYLYGDYKYTDDLQKKETIAKEKKLGIWGDYEEEIISPWMIIITIIIFAFLIYFSPKYRKKVLRKIKRRL